MQHKQLFDLSSRESIRNWLVNLVFLIYWIVIFEGALRKWVFPGFGSVIYFLKDPFVLIAYLLAFKYAMWPKRNALFTCACILALIYLIVAILQILLLNVHPLVVAYGLWVYFWYMPLAFLIGENFRGKDLARLVRQTLFVAIPIACLVYYQFKSPMDHWINLYVDPDAKVATVGQVVRTCGTFSYLTGETIFVGSTLPMLFSLWLIPRHQRPLSLPSGITASLAVIVIFLLNGSRAIFAYGLVTLAAAVLCCLLLATRINVARLICILGTLPLVCGTAAIIMINFFPEAFETQSERLQTSLDPSESNVIGRVNPLAATLALVTALQSTPVLGYGVGRGTGPASIFITGERSFFKSEGEWPRIVEDSGICGLFYLTYRLFFIGYLFVQAIESVRRSTNPLPLLLLSFTAIVLGTQEMCAGGTATYYGWLFAGFCLAANSLGLHVASREAKVSVTT
jgi:hypothetical protein